MGEWEMCERRLQEAQDLRDWKARNQQGLLETEANPATLARHGAAQSTVSRRGELPEDGQAGQ